MEKPKYYELILEYYANPFDQRTLQQLAKDIDISVEQLWRVRKEFKNDFDKDIESRKAEILNAMRPIANKGLAKKLAAGDSHALKLFYTIAGDLVERIETTNKYETVAEKRDRVSMILQKLNLNAKSLEATNSTVKSETK